MKVLQVTTHMNTGGIANYILYLSKALKEKGVPCLVVSSGGDLETELDKAGITRKRIGIRTKSEISPKVLMSIFGLARIVKEEKADIIHAHTRVAQVASFFVSKMTGVPCVTTCHGFFKTRMRKIFDTWGDKVVAISDAVSCHLKEDLGVRAGRIALIYNGVDADRFAGEYSDGEMNGIRKSLGLKDGPVIGTIGRLSPVKGQEFLVEAMVRIISRHKDAELLIAGDGPEEANLKKLVRLHGLEDAVHFTGSSPDTCRFLSVMDVFVFPSVKEGLGIALLEALAAGRACVASAVGGIGNVIEDGVNGLLVPAGDPDAIARETLKLLDDDELRLQMGKRGRSLVKERFSLDSMTDKMIELYKEVLR